MMPTDTDSICNDFENLQTDAIPDRKDQTQNDKVTNQIESEQTQSINNHVDPNKSRKSFPKSYKNDNTKSKKKTKKETGVTNNITVQNASGVTIIGSYKIFQTISGSKEGKSNVDEPSTNCIVETQEIINLKKSEVQLTPEHFNVVKDLVGFNWRNLGRKLGYKKEELDHFEFDHQKYGLAEIIYQMLLDWSRMYPEKATIGNLTNALWDLDLKETVQKLASLNVKS